MPNITDGRRVGLIVALVMVAAAAAGGLSAAPTMASAPAAAATWPAAPILSAAGESATAPQVAVAPDGAWTTPADLSAAGEPAYDPQVAVGRDGTAAAVWLRHDGSDNRVEASVIDQAFPLIPNTSKIKGKKKVRKPTTRKYKFSSPNASDASFECKVKTKQLKKMKKWRACASPYKLKVRATTIYGHTDPTPSKKRIKIKPRRG